MALQITEDLVRTLLRTVDAGLVEGIGEPIPGKMCVEAAISYALGEPHSDGPSCVDPVAVRTLKIGINDCAGWSSPLARARGMRRVAIAQLGSRDVVDPVQFMRLVSDKFIRQLIPRMLRMVYTLIPSHAEKLESAAVRCEMEGSSAAASYARAAARAAASAAASDASDAARYASYASAAASDASDARAAASAAASDAASAASDASAAASAAASSAASAAASDASAAARYASYASIAASAAASDASAAARYASYASAAASYARAAARYASYASAAASDASDASLSFACELVVQALAECGSPGCEWLWLVDATDVQS